MNWTPNYNDKNIPIIEWSSITKNTTIRAHFINFPENYESLFKDTTYLCFKINLLSNIEGLFRNNTYLLKIPKKTWIRAWNRLPHKVILTSQNQEKLIICLKKINKKTTIITKI